MLDDSIRGARSPERCQVLMLNRGLNQANTRWTEKVVNEQRNAKKQNDRKNNHTKARLAITDPGELLRVEVPVIAEQDAEKQPIDA